ncbi:BaeS Signal transduction histidine kinase [Candidatus Methylopumilus universalis]|uniref:ATP-binding protein n=1 Tax=Candidatus Methylopumilus universalis TaxID=2588536 RepID=UPI003BEEBF64
MKFIPNTLLARFLILIATALIIAQVVSIRIFDYFERGPRAEAIAQEIETVINFTRASLISSREDKRLALISELSSKGEIRIYPAYYFEDIEPLPPDPFLKVVAGKIKERLGENTIVTTNHYGVPGLWVSFSIDQDEFWAVIPTPGDRAFPWHWIGWGIIVAGLSIIGAYATATRINRPLNLLIQATEKLKKGEIPEKLPLDSVTEFRTMSQAFNEMATSLGKVDQERKVLLAGVSHDIRTPLTRLRIAIEMLPKKIASELKKSMEEDILEIDNILNQFIDYVRGFNQEATVTTNLNDFFSHMKNQHQILNRNIVLVSNLKIPIFYDIKPISFRRLFDNLINNAFSYSTGEVVITIRKHKENISISVLDDGPGIPPDHIQRLLKPFERFDVISINKKQIANNREGCGLGLAIVDKITEAHNGKLVISNRAKKGLEVKIILPLISES